MNGNAGNINVNIGNVNIVNGNGDINNGGNSGGDINNGRVEGNNILDQNGNIIGQLVSNTSFVNVNSVNIVNNVIRILN